MSNEIRQQEVMQLLTPKQTSVALNLSVKSLATWRCKGLGPTFVKIGGRVLYPKTHLLTWLAGQEANSTGQARANSSRRKEVDKI